jgi:hypothetical protein
VDDPDGGQYGDLIYEGGNYNQVEFPSQSEDQAAIDQVLGIKSDIDSMTGKPLPAPSSVTVSVMNGSGATDQATTTATALGALGFNTVGVGDTAPTGDVAETVVYYASRSPAVEAAAESVTRSMTGSVIMAYDPSQVADGAQVTVVTGTQFAVNAPSATGPGTTTTTTIPSATPVIAAPSPPTSTLQKWDPRECAAGAVPTAPVPNPT